MMVQRRARAREDAHKHFHMTAAFRSMKRGDYAMDVDVASLHPVKVSNVATENNAPQKKSLDANDIHIMKEARTRMLARDNAYKHFYMRANLRSIKRTDSFESLQQFSEAREYRRTMIPSTYKAHHYATNNNDFLLHEHKANLPTTLNDAYKEFFRKNFFYDKQRPMAITEALPPFQIVDVNKAWTQLCGYTRKEAIGHTLKELLHGPETNTNVARGLTTSLLQQAKDTSNNDNNNESGANVEYEAVLTNYRSDGQKFKNHIRVGKLKNESGDTTHFVGVFRKLSDNIYDLYANV